MLKQLRVLHQAHNLAEEGDRLLIQLLRVTNIGTDDRVEGKILAFALVELGAVLLRLDRQLATNGILGFLDMRVDVVDVEGARTLGRLRGRRHSFCEEGGQRERAEGT